jgi:antitoxin component of MazEF toxin-antitoxin module
MLKKFAKYGNSTCLVIDKGILELLNMNESSMVKLHTDGKSLIVTPVESDVKDKKVSYEAEEATKAALYTQKNKIFECAVKENLQMPSAEIQEAMQKEFTDIFAKNQPAMAKFVEISQTEAFKDAVEKLSKEIDPVVKSEKYMIAYQKLVAEFCPEYGVLQDSIQVISKKYEDLGFKS